MHKIESNEIVGTTFYTINRIRELKNGGDVLLLYFAYIEQSRIQETNKSRSLDSFMQEKMGWGKDRFYNTKNSLKDLGLIDVVQVRDSIGKITTRYVKTNFLINEDKTRTSNITYEIDSTLLEIQSPGNPESGNQDTNALSIKNKCLKNKKQNELDLAIEDFKEMRKKIDKPLTDRAKRAIIRKLDRLGETEEKKVAILEQSIIHCRQDVYPLKGEVEKPQTNEQRIKLFYEIKSKGGLVKKYEEELGTERYNRFLLEAKKMVYNDVLKL